MSLRKIPRWHNLPYDTKYNIECSGQFSSDPIQSDGCLALVVCISYSISTRPTTHEIEGLWPLHSKIYHWSKTPRLSKVHSILEGGGLRTPKKQSWMKIPHGFLHAKSNNYYYVFCWNLHKMHPQETGMMQIPRDHVNGSTFGIIINGPNNYMVMALGSGVEWTLI